MKADDTGYVAYSDDVESPFLPASTEAAHHARRKPLTLLPLIALIFFEVSGGPFGTEVRCWHTSTVSAAHQAYTMTLHV